ncbi:hypothetical protein [Micromonospora sp. LOL_023]|uniref:hypothetical protein n=1 Tax=Micromonospora sp. LOL_023 TaxID=3345418 RepID=UPI003A83BC8F
MRQRRYGAVDVHYPPDGGARAALVVAATPLDVLVVDGYVDLDPHGRPGLGRHVHDALGTAVVGVARTSFQSAARAVAVHRGGSTRPGYVTAAGQPVCQSVPVAANEPGGRAPGAATAVSGIRAEQTPMSARAC